MKFAFIAKYRSVWPILWLCQTLDVSKSGFYGWLNHRPSLHSHDDEAVTASIRTSFHSSNRIYGARRVWQDVLAEGLSCGLHRVERLMRVNALKAGPRRRRIPSNTGLRAIHAMAPNVLEQFSIMLKHGRIRYCSKNKHLTGNSTLRPQTASELLILSISGQKRAGFMWRLSLTFTHAVLSAGQ